MFFFTVGLAEVCGGLGEEVIMFTPERLKVELLCSVLTLDLDCIDMSDTLYEKDVLG
jgi:hypothetical protein